MNEIIIKPKCDCCRRIIRDCTYTESVKRAIIKYREKNPNSNKLNAKSYYDKHKENEEWRAKYNEKCRQANKRYYEKKKLLKSEEIILI
jgi:hypothetical protein